MKLRSTSKVRFPFFAIAIVSFAVGCGSASEDEPSSQGALAQEGKPMAASSVRPGRFILREADGSHSGTVLHRLTLEASNEGDVAILESHCMVCDGFGGSDPPERTYTISTTLEEGAKVYRGITGSDSVRIVDYRETSGPDAPADLLVEETVAGRTSRRYGTEFIAFTPGPGSLVPEKK